MSLHNKNSYGATDLEQGSQTLDTKDAAAGPRRFAVIAAVGVFGLLGFVSGTASSRSGAMTSLYSYGPNNQWAQQGIAAGNYWRDYGQQMGDQGRDAGIAAGNYWRDYGQKMGDAGRDYGMAIGDYYRNMYGPGGGHGGNTVSSGDTVINNKKYNKKCKVNGGNYQDSVSWQATVNGEIIKSYCPWVWQNANRKKHCKQMQNNVLVSTACPCACAGY